MKNNFSHYLDDSELNELLELSSNRHGFYHLLAGAIKKLKNGSLSFCMFKIWCAIYLDEIERATIRIEAIITEAHVRKAAHNAHPPQDTLL